MLKIKAIKLTNEFPQFTHQEFQENLETLKDRTHRNEHTGALIFLAEMFGFKKSEKIFMRIEGIQNVRGYMTAALKTLRDEEAYVVMNNIEYFYGESVLEEIKSCL